MKFYINISKISLFNTETISSCGIFQTIFHFLNKRASQTHQATQISASLASPGQFTAHHITATFISFQPNVCKKSSISSTIGIILYCNLPQVGQEIKFGFLYNQKVERISFATQISGTGSPDKDTRIVSPIHSESNIHKPMEDFIVPTLTFPASVIPICNGY
jgi:hypothetical protein